MHKVSKIALPSVLCICLLPGVASAKDCEGVIGCSISVVSKATKFIVRGATKPISIGTAGITAAVDSIADGDDAPEVIASALGGAASEAVDSVIGTMKDGVELGSSIIEATKAATAN